MGTVEVSVCGDGGNKRGQLFGLQKLLNPPVRWTIHNENPQRRKSANPRVLWALHVTVYFLLWLWFYIFWVLATLHLVVNKTLAHRTATEYFVRTINN